MAENLVVVESPAKAKTIEGFLGKGYKVVASFGHVRDLPKKELGVDIKGDFAPKYVITHRQRKVINEIKQLADKAKNLYLATDYDREGEAIAWHLIEAVKPKAKLGRITFTEITKSAITRAMKKPREIDDNLVDAQVARRVLDRLVGYKLSPFLWKKVAGGLSAGRVQSVALRLIVEREKEIGDFKIENFWIIEADFSKDGQDFHAFLEKKGDEKVELKKEKEAKSLYEKLQKDKYKVHLVDKKQVEKNPPPPYITSTLQQEAARMLYFSPKQTMMFAQRLYEAGHITYMRTDSPQMAKSALTQARRVIGKEWGEKYLPDKPRQYQSKRRSAQEAHEAIRPTHFDKMPAQLGEKMEEKQVKLYELIWKRALASQAAAAKVDQTRIEVASGKEKYIFAATGSVVNFNGFLKIWGEKKDDQIIILPDVKQGEAVEMKKMDLLAKQTQPPARYSEAGLIKELEKREIGRPSTYATIVSTIEDRNYVKKEDSRLIPSDIGILVSDLLVEHFPKVVDYEFTAKMENELDDIAENKKEWQPVVKEFYEPFAINLKEKEKELDKKEITHEKTNEKCPDCKASLILKIGRYGKFYACSKYPDCKFTKPYLEGDLGKKEAKKIEKEVEKKKCPKCKADLILREGKFGTFLGCEKYPKCKHTEPIEIKSNIKCPECGSDLVQKKTRRGRTFWGCSGYPKCKTAFWGKPIKPCPKCKSMMIEQNGNIKCSACGEADNTKLSN